LAKPELNGGRYGNPSTFTGWTGVPGLGQLLKWWTGGYGPNMSGIPNRQRLDETLPVMQPRFEQSSDVSMSATWLGHATVLVSMDNIRLITDPVWKSHASPVAFACRRYRPPPCPIEHLPPIDIGLVSHNHYDHLDSDAVTKMNDLNPRMTWFVPLGMIDFMRSLGVKNVYELNWGDHQELKINGQSIKVTCIPAQHWSQRGAFDRYKALWAGWTVTTASSRRMIFTGDTGFCEEEYRKIGRLMGPFDLALIPIGCYEPREFMRPQHINVDEAVQIHRLLRAKNSIGIHWGTYDMGSHEPYDEPPKLLRKEAERQGLKANDFVTLKHGETWIATES